ncbi:MAG: ribosome maturation factor RimM [Pseudomonadota bacterium]
MNRNDKRICLGAFAGAHGVKGAVQIKSFTQTPDAVGAYGPVETEDGVRVFTLTIVRSLKSGLVLATAPEITSREDAQALKGTRIYIDREKLPDPEPEAFYHEDLIGLDAIDETGEPMGRIKAVYNFGAGDLLELEAIPGVKGLRLVPFTKEAAPIVDLAAGRVTVIRAALEAGDEDSAEQKPENDA